jgi:hypothetical protein
LVSIGNPLLLKKHKYAVILAKKKHVILVEIVALKRAVGIRVID